MSAQPIKVGETGVVVGAVGDEGGVVGKHIPPTAVEFFSNFIITVESLFLQTLP